MNDSIEQDNISPKSQSMVMNLILPIVAGCVLSCCLNILINYFQYGKKVVKLDKNLNEYQDDDYIPNSDVTGVNMMQSIKWNIIPSIINLIVWGIIIWLVNKSISGAAKSEDDNMRML